MQGNVPIPAKAEPEKLDIPQAEPLRVECERFLQSMKNGKQPLTDGREGLRVLKVLNASQRSLDENGRKIAFGADQHPASSIQHPGCFVHPTAIIDENVTVGEGTKVWHFTHVLSGVKIGKSCNIGQNVVIVRT